MKTLFLQIIAGALLVSQGASAQYFGHDPYPPSPAQEDGNYYDDHGDDWDNGRGRGDGGVIRRDVNRVVGNGSVLDVGRILGLTGRELQQVDSVILRIADQNRRGRGSQLLAELFVNGRRVDTQYTDGRNDRVRLQTNGSGRRGIRTLQVRLSGSSAILVDMVGARLDNGHGGGGGPRGRTVQITCESFKPLSMECQAGGPILNAYVVNQRSNDDCIQGRSWYINYQNNSIVVTRGCRATFNVEVAY
jgi:hypothetical protein